MTNVAGHVSTDVDCPNFESSSEKTRPLQVQKSSMVGKLKSGQIGISSNGLDHYDENRTRDLAGMIFGNQRSYHQEQVRKMQKN